MKKLFTFQRIYFAPGKYSSDIWMPQENIHRIYECPRKIFIGYMNAPGEYLGYSPGVHISAFLRHFWAILFRFPPIIGHSYFDRRWKKSHEIYIYIFHGFFFTFGQNMSAQLWGGNGTKLLKNDVKKRIYEPPGNIPDIPRGHSYIRWIFSWGIHISDEYFPGAFIYPMNIFRGQSISAEKWTTFSFEKCKYLASENEYMNL